MAEATSWSSDVLCRYYLHGVCRQGDRCNFSHDRTNGKMDNVCKYYLKGTCTYGDQCRYDHVRTKPVDKRAQSSSSTHLPMSVPTAAAPLPLSPLKLPNGCQTNTKCPSKMVTLKKHNQTESPITPIKNPDDWVKAAEFVPGKKWQGSGPSSYVQAAGVGLENMSPSLVIFKSADGSSSNGNIPTSDSEVICPYESHGGCRYAEKCSYLHGEVCEMCDRPVLHPTDEEQRKKHAQECLRKLEEDMELSFAIQRSKDKVCGICMENIMEKKESHEQRFGILSNCNHVFCLSCIRTWRSAKQFENKIVRACPECRVKSDFVTPSKYWVDDKDEKAKLIGGYKTALSKKACKYFDEGRGDCPFNENCFYRHAYPDGRPASPKPNRRRHRQNAEGDIDLIHQIILWDFLEERSLAAHAAIARYIDDDWDDLLFHLNLARYSSDDDDSEDLSDLEVYI